MFSLNVRQKQTFSHFEHFHMAFSDAVWFASKKCLCVWKETEPMGKRNKFTSNSSIWSTHPTRQTTSDRQCRLKNDLNNISPQVPFDVINYLGQQMCFEQLLSEIQQKKMRKLVKLLNSSSFLWMQCKKLTHHWHREAKTGTYMI